MLIITVQLSEKDNPLGRLQKGTIDLSECAIRM
jgi:hypothetical protein